VDPDGTGHALSDENGFSPLWIGRSLLADAIKYVKDCVRYIIRKKRGERGEGGSFFIGVRELFVEKAATPGHVEQVVGGATLPGGGGPLEGRRRRRREKKKGGEQINVKKKGENACEGDAWVTDTRGFQNGFD